MACLIYMTSLSEQYVPRDEQDKLIDQPFKPNLLNTVVFLMSNISTLVTFVCNYRGLPFMQPLSHNIYLQRTITSVFMLCVISVTGVMPSLNYVLELVEMPDETFRMIFIGIMIADIVVTYMYVKLLDRLFYNKPIELPLKHRYRSVEHQHKLKHDIRAEEENNNTTGNNKPKSMSFSELWAQAKEQQRQAMELARQQREQQQQQQRNNDNGRRKQD